MSAVLVVSIPQLWACSPCYCSHVMLNSSSGNEAICTNLLWLRTSTSCLKCKLYKRLSWTFSYLNSHHFGSWHFAILHSSAVLTTHFSQRRYVRKRRMGSFIWLLWCWQMSEDWKSVRVLPGWWLCRCVSSFSQLLSFDRVEVTPECHMGRANIRYGSVHCPMLLFAL